MNKVHPRDAAAGIAWTTDRDTAAWFAMRFYRTGLRPFVFCFEYEPDAIITFHDGRREAEVIVDLYGLNGRRLIVDHDVSDR